jgi:hypothetical protein
MVDRIHAATLAVATFAAGFFLGFVASGGL